MACRLSYATEAEPHLNNFARQAAALNCSDVAHSKLAAFKMPVG